MWSVLAALKTTLSFTIYGSYKVGQFLVTTLQVLLTNCLHILNKLYTLLTVIIEDFTIFLRDVTTKINSVLTSLTYACEWIAASIISAWQVIVQVFQLSWTSLASLHKTGVNGVAAVCNGIKNVIIFIKQVIIMFGDGVWFIVIYLPKSGILFFVSILSYMKDLCIQVLDDISAYCKHLCITLLECISDCYYFLTDVPVESLIGIIIAFCFLYIFLQFYSIFYIYIRNKMSSCLYGLRRKYRHFKDSVIRFWPQSVQREVPRRILETEPSTKINDNIYCIICQDHPKCILVLPCRHLCLCMDCTPRLMRYGGHCPICRKRIKSTIKVYT